LKEELHLTDQELELLFILKGVRLDACGVLTLKPKKLKTNFTGIQENVQNVEIVQR